MTINPNRTWVHLKHFQFIRVDQLLIHLASWGWMPGRQNCLSWQTLNIDFCFASLQDIFRTFSQLISNLTETTILGLAKYFKTFCVMQFQFIPRLFFFSAICNPPPQILIVLVVFQCLQVVFFFLIYTVFLIALGQRFYIIKLICYSLKYKFLHFYFSVLFCFIVIILFIYLCMYVFIQYSENTKQMKQKTFLWFLS